MGKPLETSLEKLLSSQLDDRALLGELEAIAREPGFGALTWRFGPELYRRSRVVFRPFILAHFATYDTSTPTWKPVAYKEHAKTLDPWMTAVDEAGDVELFRRLWGWKYPRDEKRWRAELVRRYSAAKDPPARALALEMMQSYHPLDEATALALYRADRTSSAFIVGNLFLVFSPWRAQKPWLALARAAEGDEDFCFALYRAQVDEKTWTKDVRALNLDPKVDDAKLLAELSRRHPARVRALGPVFFELIERRGRGVLPYVFQHMQQLSAWSFSDRRAFRKLVARAEREGWMDLWGALLRTAASHDEFNEALRALLQDRELSESKLAERLLTLSGAAREWNFVGLGIAQVRPLDDANAVLFFERFPRMLEQHFLSNLAWWGGYPKLVSALVDARSEELIDYVASRMITRALPEGASPAKETIELLAAYYEGLKRGAADMARRASQVLTRVPARSIWNYDAVIRGNRLARLLFERSLSAYLDDPIAVRDLLESPEIHVQLLAFRVLAQPDDRARGLAAENLDLLEPTLLRKLHRKTRIEALRALGNAALSAEHARRILAKSRDVFALPDKRYPKEALVQLMGGLLHRYPELRAPKEVPIIHRKEARA